MPRRVLIILLLWSLALIAFSVPWKSEAEESIPPKEIMTIERCIELALQKHPEIIAARSTVKANQNRVGQAEAQYYPQISGVVGYRRFSSTSATGVTSFSETSNQYSGSVSLSQMLYDFGRAPDQVEIRNLNLDASRSDLTDVSDQLIFNVKQAYYGVLQARRNREVAAETVRQSELHRDQAKGFFEVGTKPKFDLTQAEVNLNSAKLNLIKAENGLKIAAANLNNAMGVPNAPEYTVEDNLSFQGYPVTMDEALQKAYETRPALKSIVAKRTAAERSIDLARKDYFPELTGNASYTWAGKDFPLDHGWNVGATLSFPLFNGFETRYQVEESKQNLNAAKADEVLLRQNIFLEVQRAYFNLQEAKERIPVAEMGVKQAEENLDIARGRYAAGIGNPIEVTDAEVALSTAKTAHIQALYDYKIAQAGMERDMGTK